MSFLALTNIYWRRQQRRSERRDDCCALPWRRCLVVCLFVFAQFIDFGTERQHCIPTHRVLCQNIRQDDRTTCSGCLLLIKKTTTQKHKNIATTAAQVRDNRSERPCGKTRREDCRLRRNQLVHLSLNIQEAQVLAQTLYCIIIIILFR